MTQFAQLNYDELTAVSKNLKDEGEDITRLLAVTRQRVESLHKDWVGESADRFFDEMETEVLPFMHRVSQALFVSKDVLNQIMQTIHAADEETSRYFNIDVLSAAGILGVPGVAAGLAQAASSAGIDVQPAIAPDSLGAAAPGADETQQTEEQQTQETPQASDTQPSGGGGGAGGGDSQGLQGDLKNMGLGLVDQTPQTGAAGGAAASAQDLPDHVFGSGTGGSGQGNVSVSGSAGSGGASPVVPDGGGNAAAGIAGVAGSAAVGGAAKVIKDNSEKEGDLE